MCVYTYICVGRGRSCTTEVNGSFVIHVNECRIMPIVSIYKSHHVLVACENSSNFCIVHKSSGLMKLLCTTNHFWHASLNFPSLSLSSSISEIVITILTEVRCPIGLHSFLYTTQQECLKLHCNSVPRTALQQILQKNGILPLNLMENSPCWQYSAYDNWRRTSDSIQ